MMPAALIAHSAARPAETRPYRRRRRPGGGGSWLDRPRIDDLTPSLSSAA
jgi:hypothetical protein